MRRDEFLLQTVTLDQWGVATACEHQSVVASQQKRHCYPAKRAITVDQGLLQGRFSCARLGRSRQVPTQDLTGVAIDHHGQTRPTISSRLNAAQVRGPKCFAEFEIRRASRHFKPTAQLADRYFDAF